MLLNPFFMSRRTSHTIREALLSPIYNSLTPRKASELATSNYTGYIQELWKIKQAFNLTYMVREVEVAFWSFGIRYLKKYDEKLPLEFSHSPNPLLSSRSPRTW